MKTMVITGTTQGIGYELFRFFSNNYRVITINRRFFEGNNYICDLSNLTEVVATSESICQQKPDILINNAGGAEPVLFEDLSVEELVRCTNLNYHAPVILMQSVLGGMKERGYGRVINISSIASKSPRPLIPHYGAAKSALERFSASMAVAYGGCGISINCVCPGGICTQTSYENRKQMARIQGLQFEHYNNMIVEQNGLNRFIEAKEVVALVNFLLSEQAVAISGQTYNICGVKEIH